MSIERRGWRESIAHCPSIPQAEEIMPTEINRDDVRRAVEGRAQLVEVLPSKQYEEEHLPGAINIPLKKLDQQATARLQRDRPVIVYCYDYQ
jgi:rhodanese-related sulfurtransferase